MATDKPRGEVPAEESERLEQARERAVNEGETGAELEAARAAN
jgi:hypothetical protein